LDVFVEPENRMALVLNPMFIAMIYKENYRYGVSSLHETSETVSPFRIGYAMHVALKDIVSLKASQLFESGLHEREIKTKIHLEDFKSKSQAIGPQVLTLSHLGAGFVVILVLLGLSTIAFAFECSPILLKKLKKLISISVACYVVVKFTKMNKML
jgi:hypothetical protein